MPQIRRELSWLSPKRRRTTGNLKSDVLVNAKATSSESNRASIPDARALVRPSASHRPLSVPVGNAEMAEGDLFYAYARNENDTISGHLLTFASASVAEEWWLLLQLHFPTVSRPEPQRFFLQNSDSLAEIWTHASFSHLKSKWMYISLPGAGGERLGGAAQGLVPAQGMLGRLLDGDLHEVDELLPGLRAEVREVEKHGSSREAARLEEYITSMMEALQRNTEKAAELAAKIQAPVNIGNGVKRQDSVRSPGPSAGYFDVDTLSTHLKQLNQTLRANSQHVEKLTDRHSANEESLRSALETVSNRQNDDRLDMQRLSGHLDRIQSMMEEVVQERKDSAREIVERPPQVSIDLSPLTERLERVQDAVEQNSALIKNLLEQRAETDEQPRELDVTPLKDSLEKIHAAVEQQSEHTKALVGFASAQDGKRTESSGAAFHERSLAPLSEHLEQIYNVIEEGNRHARESKAGDRIDLGPLTEHLEAIRESTAAHTDAINQLAEPIPNNPRDDLDLSPLSDRLDNIHTTLSQRQTSTLNSDLTSHLSHLQTLTKQNATSTQDLLKQSQKHATSTTKLHNSMIDTTTQIRQLLERDKEHETRIEAQNSQMRELMSGQRELVEVVRQLARSLAKEGREGNGGCGHVIIPPPRKMNKKLVGFVYDAKDGRG